MMVEANEKPLRVKEAMEYLGVSRATFYRLIGKGMPFHQKPRTQMFLFASEIAEWIKK
jgi:excisionase family DNA binding protein